MVTLALNMQGGGVGALLLGLIYAFQEKLVRPEQLCQLQAGLRVAANCSCATVCLTAPEYTLEREAAESPAHSLLLSSLASK
jgi:hypothetical protein